MHRIAEILKKYWGYDDFLPLQQEAIQCGVSNRDSLVVLPTGGGKSLCFQVPAVRLAGLAIVVSPLISLMKDQVDALKDMGIKADCLNSSMPAYEQAGVNAELRAGKIKILYIIDGLGGGGKERQLIEILKGTDREKFTVGIITFNK